MCSEEIYLNSSEVQKKWKLVRAVIKKREEKNVKVPCPAWLKLLLESAVKAFDAATECARRIHIQEDETQTSESPDTRRLERCDGQTLIQTSMVSVLIRKHKINKMSADCGCLTEAQSTQNLLIRTRSDLV